MSLTLTPDELAELTDRHTRPAQIRVLKAMGVPYLDDGRRVKVLREALTARGATPPLREPDFSIFTRAA